MYLLCQVNNRQKLTTKLVKGGDTEDVEISAAGAVDNGDDVDIDDDAGGAGEQIAGENIPF